MRETCRICGRELCGNQRRWIFHTGARLNLQVLLSHALGREVSRDGKGGEFACSKCAFMLERIYRFDTVIARIEALSLERLQKLLLEKDRLKLCVAGMYRKNNGEEAADDDDGDDDEKADGSGLPDAGYSALLQEDFAYSGFECWTEPEDRLLEAHTCHAADSPSSRPRRCRGCAVLRVADADYEAICKIPRKVARNVSCGPSSRWSASASNEEPPLEEPTGAASLPCGKAPLDEESMEEGTPGSSLESLDTTVAAGPSQQKDEEAGAEAKGSRKCDCCVGEHSAQSLLPHRNRLDVALRLVRAFDCKPVQSPRGSKLPVPVKSSPLCQELMDKSPYPGFFNVAAKPQSGATLAFSLEMSDLQELWEDLYVDYMPLQVKNVCGDQQTLAHFDLPLGKQASELNNSEVMEKINCLNATNKQLQEQLDEMTFELRYVQQASQRQDHRIQHLNETVKSKENECEELNHVIDEQNETITKLQDMLHRSQLGQLQISEGSSTLHQQQIGLLNVQNTLVFTQLEVQRLKRAQQQRDHQLTEAKKTTQLLETMLQGEQQQKEVAWKHNKELRATLQQLKTELQAKNWQYSAWERDKLFEMERQEQKIKHLNHNLTFKEQLLQESKELLLYLQKQDKNLTSADKMVQRLQQRIKDRDAALEQAVDEKFCVLEDKEQELQQLRLSVKEQEHDLEGLQQVLSSNKATIQDLESLLKAKDLEHEHLLATYQNLQWLKEEMEAKLCRWHSEQEEMIQQLQTALRDRNKEVEVLSTTLLCKLEPGQRDTVKELCLRLHKKEKFIEELLHDKSLQTVEQVKELQELLRAVSTREQQSHVLKQGNSGTSITVSERENDGSKVAKGALETTAGLEKELINAKEELELLTRKERETRLELSALQSVVASQEEELQVQASDVESLTRSIQIKEELIKDLQMQLIDPEEMPAIEQLTQEVLMLREKIARMELQGQEDPGNKRSQLLLALESQVAERNQLNETLKTEKQLYSNLVKLHAHPASSGPEQTLQVELEEVQELRRQLEEALGRGLEHLSRLESLHGIGGGEQERVTVLPKHAF